MKEDAIKKYIEGNATRAEKQAIYAWLREDPSNQKKLGLLKAKYIADSLKDVPNHSISKKYQEFNKKKTKGNKSPYISSIAAVAVLLFVASIVLYQNNGNIPFFTDTDSQTETASTFVTVNTEDGSKKEVVLPDGSIALLNIDSKLVYPEEFGADIREITLIGEAFFDIAHNKQKPFIVNTNNMKVKVLGTSFNVKSYPDDKKVETTLVTGKVELIREKESSVILEPSQKAVFDKSVEKMEIEEVETSDVTAWREGKLIFNKTSMEQVIKDLERKYNTTFNINSPDLLHYEYTGTFDNLTLEEVLQLLIISSPIEYTITKNKTIVLNMK